MFVTSYKTFQFTLPIPKRLINTIYECSIRFPLPSIPTAIFVASPEHNKNELRGAKKVLKTKKFANDGWKIAESSNENVIIIRIKAHELPSNSHIFTTMSTFN